MTNNKSSIDALVFVKFTKVFCWIGLCRKTDDLYEYNNDRPHQALQIKYPGEIYMPSTKAYKGLPDVVYPFHDKTIKVTNCGRACLKGKKINLTSVLAGQNVGIKEVEDDIWLVSFMEYDLGYFDEQTCKLEPLPNPLGPKVLPMSPE